MLYGPIQNNNSACFSDPINSNQIEQKLSFKIWTETQKSKISNFEQKHFDWCYQK